MLRPGLRRRVDELAANENCSGKQKQEQYEDEHRAGFAGQGMVGRREREAEVLKVEVAHLGEVRTIAKHALPATKRGNGRPKTAAHADLPARYRCGAVLAEVVAVAGGQRGHGYAASIAREGLLHAVAAASIAQAVEGGHGLSRPCVPASVKVVIMITPVLPCRVAAATAGILESGSTGSPEPVIKKF
jgi:hypothetical protein